MREKFYITNISCASCVDKIESVLHKLECVSYVNIDINNNTLEIDTTNIDLAIKTIKSIESNVNISKEIPKIDEFNTKNSLYKRPS